MAHHIIEFDRKCQFCDGTGLCVGRNERDGAAVVCYKCKGTGCEHVFIEYDDFQGRIKAEGIERVFLANRGIMIWKGNGKYKLSDFGGMSIEEWESGKKFAPGMETRNYACPAWYYRIADPKKAPDWHECSISGNFKNCPKYKTKGECWERWDKENK